MELTLTMDVQRNEYRREKVRKLKKMLGEKTRE